MHIEICRSPLYAREAATSSTPEFSSHADCGGIWICDERRKESWRYVRGCDIEEREPRGKPVVKRMGGVGVGSDWERLTGEMNPYLFGVSASEGG